MYYYIIIFKLLIFADLLLHKCTGSFQLLFWNNKVHNVFFQTMALFKVL